MPWVRFLRNFDWTPTPAVTVAFKAGSVKLVTTACARRAIATGAAEKTAKPKARAKDASHGG
jgi:hypothetical protein